MRQLSKALSIVLFLGGFHATAGPLEDARATYESRSEDLDPIKEAINSLDEHASSATGTERLESLRLLSRMSYYVGAETAKSDKDEKASRHEQGFKYVDAAMAEFFDFKPIEGLPKRGANSKYLAKAKEFAEAKKGADVPLLNDLVYLRSINMAAYGQLQSAIKQLRLLRYSRGLLYFINLMDGESNTYGANRALGWIEYNAGDPVEGLARLQSAYENTLVSNLPGKQLSKSAGTNFYYASALLNTLNKPLNLPGQAELGRKIMGQLAGLTDAEVEKLDPKAIAETKARRAEAQEVMSGL